MPRLAQQPVGEGCHLSPRLPPEASEEEGDSQKGQKDKERPKPQTRSGGQDDHEPDEGETTKDPHPFPNQPDCEAHLSPIPFHPQKGRGRAER